MSRSRRALHREPRRRWWRGPRPAAVLPSMVAATTVAALVAVVPGLRVLAERSPSLVVSALSRVSSAPAAPAGAGGEAAGAQPPVASAARPAPASPAPASASASEGSAESARPAGAYRVVGLGDSVPAAAACGCTSYVTLAAAAAARRQGRPARVTNLARSGLTTAGLVQQVKDPAVRAELAAADLVIITIGANDFDPDVLTTAACAPVTELSCYRDTLSGQRDLLAALLVDVGRLTAARHGVVVLTGYWSVFLDGGAARALGDDYVAASTALTRAENTLLASIGAEVGATYVDLFTPFRGAAGTADDTALLAPDADHPNAAGHALIARSLLAALAANPPSP